MKILIIDERKGNAITDEIKDKIFESDIHLTIQPDGHVNIHVDPGMTYIERRRDEEDGGNGFGFEAEFVQVPHRDEISGAKSASRDLERESRRNAVDRSAEPAMAKAKRALAPGRIG